MRLGLAALLLAGFAAAGRPASAQGACDPAVAADPSPRQVVLRAGTEIGMATTEPLSSKTARQGQRIGLEVTGDVRVDGRLVIPRGTVAVGEVARVVNRGKFGKSGKLELRAMFVELGGRRIRLEGSAGGRGRSGTAPVVATALLIGASASLITGKSAILPAGTRLRSYVYQDVPLLVGTR